MSRDEFPSPVCDIFLKFREGSSFIWNSVKHFITAVVYTSDVTG